MERIFGAAAMRLGIGQRRDDAAEFKDRTRPAVRQHQWRGLIVF